MNIEQIIRNFNLYIIFDIPLSDAYLSLYNDLQNLNKYKSNNKNWSNFDIYGLSINKILIHFNKDTEVIWVDVDNGWSSFKHSHSLKLNKREFFKLAEYTIENILCLKGEIREQDSIWDNFLRSEYLIKI